MAGMLIGRPLLVREDRGPSEKETKTSNRVAENADKECRECGIMGTVKRVPNPISKKGTVKLKKFLQTVGHIRRDCPRLATVHDKTVDGNSQKRNNKKKAVSRGELYANKLQKK